MLEVLLQHVPTPSVERELMSELSDLYSGYFGLLASDDRLPEAFAVIERAHGRLEAESLWYDKLKPAETESPQERVVNSLELQLLDAVDQKQRSALLSRIYDAEQKLPTYCPGPSGSRCRSGRYSRNYHPAKLFWSTFSLIRTRRCSP